VALALLIDAKSIAQDLVRRLGAFVWQMRPDAGACTETLAMPLRVLKTQTAAHVARRLTLAPALDVGDVDVDRRYDDFASLLAGSVPKGGLSLQQPCQLSVATRTE